MSPELLAAASRAVEMDRVPSEAWSADEYVEYQKLTFRKFPDIARAAITQHEEIERLKADLKRAKNSLRYITNSAQLSLCHEEASAVLKGIQ